MCRFSKGHLRYKLEAWEAASFCIKPVSVKYTSVCWAQLTRKHVCGKVVIVRKVLDHVGYTCLKLRLGKVDTGWPAILLNSAEGLLPAGNQFLLSFQISLYVAYTNLKMDLILQLVDFLWIKLHSKDIVIKSTRRRKCHKKQFFKEVTAIIYWKLSISQVTLSIGNLHVIFHLFCITTLWARQWFPYVTDRNVKLGEVKSWTKPFS